MFKIIFYVTSLVTFVVSVNTWPNELGHGRHDMVPEVLNNADVWLGSIRTPSDLLSKLLFSVLLA